MHYSKLTLDQNGRLCCCVPIIPATVEKGSGYRMGRKEISVEEIAYGVNCVCTVEKGIALSDIVGNYIPTQVTCLFF